MKKVWVVEYTFGGGVETHLYANEEVLEKGLRSLLEEQKSDVPCSSDRDAFLKALEGANVHEAAEAFNTAWERFGGEEYVEYSLKEVKGA